MVSKEKVCGTGRLFTYKEFKEKLEGYKKDGHYEMALEGAKIGLPKLYKRYMDECQGNTISLAVSEDIEKLFAAVREQMGRVPYLSKKKCYKIFILNLILNSGLEYGEVMSFLDSLNAYEESDKGWKKVSSNTPIEEKFDALDWDKVVMKLIGLATSHSNSLAA
jgi:hypothetical protein